VALATALCLFVRKAVSCHLCACTLLITVIIWENCRAESHYASFLAIFDLTVLLASLWSECVDNIDSGRTVLHK